MKIELDIDFEGLLNNAELKDLKKGKYPFPSEYANLKEVKKLINKTIDKLDVEVSKYKPFRNEILRGKYWKIIKRASNATTVKYIQVISLNKNDKYGGSCNANVLTFYRHFGNIEDIHTNRNIELNYHRLIQCSFWHDFDIYRFLDDGTQYDNKYYHNKNLSSFEILSSSEKEFNDKIEELSIIIKNEHEKVL